MSLRARSPPRERIGSLYGAPIEPKPGVALERQVADVGTRALSVLEGFEDTFIVYIDADLVGKSTYMRSYLRSKMNRFAVSVRCERLNDRNQRKELLMNIGTNLMKAELNGPMWSSSQIYKDMHNCYFSELAGGITTILSTGTEKVKLNMNDLYVAAFEGAAPETPFSFDGHDYKYKLVDGTAYVSRSAATS
jgi:hypothetical protein